MFFSPLHLFPIYIPYIYCSIQFHTVSFIHISMFLYAPTLYKVKKSLSQNPNSSSSIRNIFRSMKRNSCSRICCPLFCVISPLYLIKNKVLLGKHSEGNQSTCLYKLQRLCVSQIKIWLCEIKHFPFCFYLSLNLHNVALWVIFKKFG